jgi:hypothetical protein
MKPDAQIRQWWVEYLGKDPIPDRYVIYQYRRHYNKEGHPESPRLWDRYISKMITTELGFNRIQAIRVFAVRVTPVFANKKHALNT